LATTSAVFASTTLLRSLRHDPAPPELSTLSLHDALPISARPRLHPVLLLSRAHRPHSGYDNVGSEPMGSKRELERERLMIDVTVRGGERGRDWLQTAPPCSAGAAFLKR